MKLGCLQSPGNVIYALVSESVSLSEKKINNKINK